LLVGVLTMYRHIKNSAETPKSPTHPKKILMMKKYENGAILYWGWLYLCLYLYCFLF